MAMAADGQDADQMGDGSLSFLEEIQALETVHDDPLSVSTRLNNRTTVTGFKNITTSELDAICNRHGKIYTAKITPEGIKPQIFLKFKDAPEVDEEKGAAGVDTSNIKATNVDTVIAGISELLGGVCVSRKAVRTTWTLCFDVRTVTMAQCVALRQHPSYSIIDVIIRASSGVVIVFSEKNDTKTSLRYLKKHEQQHFVPTTASVGWHRKKNMLTASHKKPAPARKASDRTHLVKTPERRSFFRKIIGSIL